MCVTVPTKFSVKGTISIKRYKTPFRVLVLAKNIQETVMNKDQIEGRVEEAKGKVKEAAGVILDDKELEIEGNVQKNIGKAQSGFGDLKKTIKDNI